MTSDSMEATKEVKQGGQPSSSAQKAAATTEEIPPDILAYKERLERTTGKKYVYRGEGREERPDLMAMMAHGVPGKPRSWVDILGFPALLLLLFVASFWVFLQYLQYVGPSKRPPMVLPTMNRLVQQQQQQQQQEFRTYGNPPTANDMVAGDFVNEDL